MAAFMVVTWHFAHGWDHDNGRPVPFNQPPLLFPLSIFDEGHTGVALFMTLSGYLFAKLLDGKTIRYAPFLWNRAVRLLPLLLVVILLAGVKAFLKGEDMRRYALSIVYGVVYPTLPNGGWSITVEAHYYLILPIFLWMLKRSPLLPLSVVACALALRAGTYHAQGSVQWLAYWTIVGRVDQFALGMLMFHFRSYFAHRHAWAAVSIALFTAFYWYFDATGGFYNGLSYPSTRPLWIVLPTIEALVYAMAIAWYEGSFTPSDKGVSRFIALIGTYSYSIYLLHFFVVFHASSFVHERVMDISNFYLAWVWAGVFFILMMIPGYLSFRFIESPFLKLRRRYIAAAP